MELVILHYKFSTLSVYVTTKMSDIRTVMERIEQLGIGNDLKIFNISEIK